MTKAAPVKVLMLLGGILFVLGAGAVALRGSGSREAAGSQATDRAFAQMRILVCDYPSMATFYRDVLELPVRFVGVEYVEFEGSGGATVGLYARSRMPGVEGDCDTGSSARSDRAVLVLRVRDLDEVAAALADRGAELVVAPRDREEWGLRTAHLRDPEGNLIELIERLECRDQDRETGTSDPGGDTAPPPACL